MPAVLPLLCFSEEKMTGVGFSWSETVTIVIDLEGACFFYARDKIQL